MKQATLLNRAGGSSKNILGIVIATAVILSIPLIAMQFTDEVVWGPLDFVIIGTLLIGTGLAYEFIARKMKNTTQRILLAIVLLIALLLMWAQLAVGIFGTPFSGS